MAINILVLRDYRSLSKHAALLVSELVLKKPRAVLGLATGSTPLGLYRRLARVVRRGGVDFSGVTTFNLDEYYPISRNNPQSYHHYMCRHVWGPLGIAPARAHIPHGNPADLAAVCREYELEIEQAGGIDLQVLGIGVNGHIGFNEPGSQLIAQTHLALLSPETIASNSRFFEKPDDVPRNAISMGLGTIMKAREILLLASGKSKAWAVGETIKGGLTTRVPASLLQLHPRVTVMLDREAASHLRR